VRGLFWFGNRFMDMKNEYYPHPFSVDEARERVRALTAYWDWRYGTRTQWRGNIGEFSGKALGVRFKGMFFIEPGVLRGQMLAGFLGERLGGRAYLLRKLNDYMDPHKSLDELWARVKDEGLRAGLLGT